MLGVVTLRRNVTTLQASVLPNVHAAAPRFLRRHDGAAVALISRQRA
jgi:hypothetical protein